MSLHLKSRIKLPIWLVLLSGFARCLKTKLDLYYALWALQRYLKKSTWNSIYFPLLIFLWVGTAFPFKQLLSTLCTSPRLDDKGQAVDAALIHVLSSLASIPLASIRKTFSLQHVFERRVWKEGGLRTLICALQVFWNFWMSWML